MSDLDALLYTISLSSGYIIAMLMYQRYKQLVEEHLSLLKKVNLLIKAMKEEGILK